MTDYIHDVFISYRREKFWTPWTREHFKDLLSSYLQQDLGFPPKIFVDERLEGDFGTDWPDELGNHLATSRVLVPVFSADYFSSDWCVHELDLMHHRMQSCPAVRLIIPVIVHDGDLIPDPIARLQPAKFHSFRIAGLIRGTNDFHEFSKAMGELSPRVAQAVKGAPAFDASWVTTCQARFGEVFKSPNSRIAPTSFDLKTAPPATVPRPAL